MHQQPQTPYDYLRALKEKMQMEYEKLLHNKAAYSKAVDIEMVMLYRVIEKKMLDFIEDLTNKKVKKNRTDEHG